MNHHAIAILGHRHPTLFISRIVIANSVRAEANQEGQVVLFVLLHISHYAGPSQASVQFIDGAGRREAVGHSRHSAA